MKKAVLTVGALSCLYTNAQFVKTFGDQPNESAQSVFLTNTNNYLVAGHHDAGFFGNRDAVLSLFDQNGNLVVPPVSYGGSDADVFNSTCQVTIGGPARYVAVGETKSFGSGDSDIYLVGVDASLRCVFQRTFGGVNGDKAHRIIEVNDAYYGPCFAIIGSSTSYTTPARSNVYMLLVSRNGTLLTSAVIGTNNDDSGFWIEQATDGGYIICGGTNQPTFCQASPFPKPYSTGIYVIKMAPTTGPNLTMQWDLIYGINPSTGSSQAGFVVKENVLGSSYVVTGSTSSAGAGGADVFIIGVDYSGIPLGGPCMWGGPRDEYPTDMIVDSQQGNFIVSGYSNSFSALNDYNAFIIDNPCGPAKQKIYADNGSNDYSYSMSKNVLGGYMMVGKSDAFTPGNEEIYLVATDNNFKTSTACESDIEGALSGGTYCTAGGSLAYTVEGRTNVPCNYHELSWKENSCPTIKSMETAAKTTVEQEKKFELMPNPASTEVVLTYNESYHQGTVNFIDPQGRVIKTLVLTNEKTMRISINDLPAGIYLVNMTGLNGNTETKRLVKTE